MTDSQIFILLLYDILLTKNTNEINATDLYEIAVGTRNHGKFKTTIDILIEKHFLEMDKSKYRHIITPGSRYTEFIKKINEFTRDLTALFNYRLNQVEEKKEKIALKEEELRIKRENKRKG